MKPIEYERAKSVVVKNPKAALNHALALARGEFPDIPKNRTAVVRMKEGGSYSYKYADLSDVFHAINPVLSAYGLAISQEPVGNELLTTVMHEDGAERVYKWPIKPMPKRDLGDAQSFQSAVQLAKRYALTAALGITTEETVEGDPRFSSKKLPDPVTETFETPNGIRMPKGAKWTQSMTKRQLAEEAARAIAAQFDEPKTEVGLNGAWSRNEGFIEMLKDRHSDLYQEVFDAFEIRLNQMEAAE